MLAEGDVDRNFPAPIEHRGHGERPEFTDSVRKAKLLVENQYERKLDGGKPAGAIFALKNMGWSDRRRTRMRG